MQKQKLNLKQKQKLLPQQIQLLNMFRLSTDEFEQYVKNEVEENTSLEQEESDENFEIPFEKNTNFYNHSKEKKEIPLVTNISFQQFLQNQLSSFQLENEELDICTFLVGSIDEQGYLRREILDLLDDLAFIKNIFVDEKKIKSLFKNVIHKLEPVGVGAKNLQECLKIQLENKEKTPIINHTLKIITEIF